MCWLSIRSVALLVFFISALTHVRSDHHYQIFCNISQPEKDDCLTLFEAFRDGIFRQRDNLFRLDLVFNPASGTTPVLVRAVYNMNLTGIDECTEVNQTVVLGWTSQSLYRYFHAAVINEVRLQLPYAVLQLLEYNMHSLEGEPFVDDYLWIGSDESKLPEVRLSINADFSDGRYTSLSKCPSNETLQKALGEITYWLRACAKVAQRNNEQAQQLANPDYKGYTLPHDAVMRYTDKLWNTTRGQVGEGVFLYLYLLNIAFTLVLFMYLLFSSRAYDMYDHTVEVNKIQLQVAAYLALTYLVFFVISDIVQGTILPTRFDWFLILKFLSAGVIYFVVLISTLKCIYCKLAESICFKSALVPKNCTKNWVVAVLASLTSILALDITPTTVLFFVFPTDTFSLLAIHIALFYTEVMVGTVFVRWWKDQSVKKWCQSVKKWCQYNSIKNCEYSPVTSDEVIHQHETSSLSQDPGHQALTCVINIIVQVLFIIVCALVYFPAMYFFQFLILRNANNGAFDILIKYIPSIAIGFFGIFIRKKILQDKDDKDDKDTMAKILWLKLGELLTTEQVDGETKYLESLRAAFRFQTMAETETGRATSAERVNEEKKQ